MEFLHLIPQGTASDCLAWYHNCWSPFTFQSSLYPILGSIVIGTERSSERRVEEVITAADWFSAQPRHLRSEPPVRGYFLDSSSQFIVSGEGIVA